MSLVSHYKLNGDVQDSSGNGHHGTLTDGRYVGGVDRKGVCLSGITNCTITLPSTAAGTGPDIAISFWANMPNPISGSILRQNTTAGAYNLNLHFPWHVNYNLYWDQSNNAATYNRINGPVQTDFIGDGVLRHYVVQTNSVTDIQEIYIDGKLFLSGSSKIYPYVNSGQDIWFGRFTTASWWAGKIADIRFYDQALTSEQVETLFLEFHNPLVFHMPFPESRKFADYSSYSRKVISSGLNSARAFVNGSGKVSKYSAYFNGDTSTYLNCELQKAYLPPWSWGCWFYKNQNTVASYPIFMSFGLPYITSNSGVTFRASFRSGGIQSNISGTTVPVLNTWYHLLMIASETGTYLYVNGVLEASSGLVSDALDQTNFDVGRHRSDDNYRLWGRIDDVRFYDKVLTQTEIDIIVDPDLDRIKMSFRKNGEIEVQQIDEDIEWELLDNFQSSYLDGGITPYDTAIGGNNITSAATISAAGWTSTMSAFDITSYATLKGFLQAYVSGAELGYLQKALPSGYDQLKVVWGNWYTGTTELYLDGVLKRQLSGSYGVDVYCTEYSGTPVLKIQESGIVWISEVWVGKSRRKPIELKQTASQNISIVQASKSPNLSPYTDWNVGAGSVGIWIQNGVTTYNPLLLENVRYLGGDPWDQPTILWECRPDAVSGPDGGWTSDLFSINQNVAYRYSVWVKRNKNGGSFYHGCYGYSGGANIGVRILTTGVTTTNPYFFVDNSVIPLNTWVLVVGHVWPTTTPTTIIHPNSGVYLKSGKYSSSITDFAWLDTTTHGKTRTYLYYSTDTLQRQILCYPMVEACDGTENPIGDLINGKAYGNLWKGSSEIHDVGEATPQIGSDLKIYTNNKLILK